MAEAFQDRSGIDQQPAGFLSIGHVSRPSVVQL
jgi:hypothetical protein